MIKKKSLFRLLACIFRLLACIFILLSLMLPNIIVTQIYSTKLIILANQLFSYQIPDQTCRYIEKASRYRVENKLCYRVISVVKSNLDIDSIKEYYDKAYIKGQKGNKIEIGIHDVTKSMELDLISDSKASFSRKYEDNGLYISYYALFIYDYDEISSFDLNN